MRSWKPCSGEEALRLIDDGLHPDIVLTDHLMPGMTGVELAKALRIEPSRAPLLIISGYAEEDGIDASLARLTKPFRNSELTASLAALTTIVRYKKSSDALTPQASTPICLGKEMVNVVPAPEAD